MSASHPERGKAFAVTGAVLQLGPVLGVLPMVVGIIRAFNNRETLQPGTPEFHATVGFSLMGTSVGLGFGLVGVILICIALVSYRYRAEWFFSFLVLHGCLSLLGFPLGTAVGVFFLIYCISHRHEFRRTDSGTCNS